jgi:hypothetical protein
MTETQFLDPNSPDGQKVTACENALEALLNHVGYNIWMTSVVATMAKSQAKASPQEFDAYVKKVGDMLWTQHRYDVALIKPKLVS